MSNSLKLGLSFHKLLQTILLYKLATILTACAAQPLSAALSDKGQGVLPRGCACAQPYFYLNWHSSHRGAESSSPGCWHTTNGAQRLTCHFVWREQFQPESYVLTIYYDSINGSLTCTKTTSLQLTMQLLTHYYSGWWHQVCCKLANFIFVYKFWKLFLNPF